MRDNWKDFDGVSEFAEKGLCEDPEEAAASRGDLKTAGEKLYRALCQDLEKYILENWDPAADEEVPVREYARPGEKRILSADEETPGRDDFSGVKGHTFGDGISKAVSLEDLIGEVGKSFHEMLFDMIAESGMTDVEVYKRAGIDRKLFSKIRNNPAYHPRKSTVLALAIALKLDLGETQELLSGAEYAFSPGSKADVIVRYFIERGVCDIHTINIALYEHGLPILE